MLNGWLMWFKEWFICPEPTHGLADSGEVKVMALVYFLFICYYRNYLYFLYSLYTFTVFIISQRNFFNGWIYFLWKFVPCTLYIVQYRLYLHISHMCGANIKGYITDIWPAAFLPLLLHFKHFCPFIKMEWKHLVFGMSFMFLEWFTQKWNETYKK